MDSVRFSPSVRLVQRVRPSSSAPAGNAPSFSLSLFGALSFNSPRKLVRSRTPCSIRAPTKSYLQKKADGGRLEPEEIREKKGAKKNLFATPSLVTMKLSRWGSTLTLRRRRLSNLTEEVQHNSWKGRKELGEAKHHNVLISFHMHRLPHLL